MRTLGEMIDRIRRHLNDQRQSGWDEPDIRDTLEDAARMVAEDLDNSRYGRQVLRRIGDATEFTADEEVYELPADCMELESVEYNGPGDDRYHKLYRKDPQSRRLFRSGNIAQFSAGAAAIGRLYIYDDVDEGSVRIWPAFTAEGLVNSTFRLVYYGYLTFPESDVGTFNDPEATGTDVFRYPESLATAIELRTAAELSGEELGSAEQVNYFSARYQAEFDRLANTRGRGFGPRHNKYVKMA